MDQRGNSFFKKILQGIRYRLSPPAADNAIYQLSRLRKIILKHQPAGKLRKIRIGTHEMVYKDPMEMYHCYVEIFQHGIYDFKAVHSQVRIIDCGANMGAAVCYLKDRYPQSELIAFEPDENNFALLQQNAGRLPGVRLEKKAVWTYNGTISFQHTGTLSSKIGEAEEGVTVTTIDCVRLADYLTNPVDMLKIDIEGAEYEVLKDCATSLSNVANLFIEYHGGVHETGKLAEIIGIAENAGFNVYIKEANDIFAKPFIQKNLPHGGFEVQLNIFCYRK